MGKQNTKASATQLSQEMAAAEAAKQQEQQQQQEGSEQQQQDTSTGTQDVSGAGEQSSSQEVSQKQDSSEGSSDTEQKSDLTVTPSAPAAPVVVEDKPVVIEAAAPVPANQETTDRLASILKDVPGAYQADISRVLSYVERMAPLRPIDARTGVAEQVALYRSIQNIINRQEQYFRPLFTALLYIFKVEGTDGCLSDRYRMRFMDNITLSVGDRKAFASLTLMLHITADPKSRALGLSQLNLEKTLENGLTADGRKRVLAYFGK